MSQTLVVSGAAGFLGRHVLGSALRAGYSVRGVVRAGEWVTGTPPVSLDVLDWSNEDVMARLFARARPNVIVHCAGANARQDEGEEVLRDANVTLIRHLLAAVGRVVPESRVVVLSSAAVYGPRPPVPTREDAELAPATDYAVSKVMAEEETRSFVGLGGNAVIARPFNTVGAGEPAGSVVGALAAQILSVPAGELARVRLREVASVRDFLDVDDCADALLALASRGAAGAAYNVCSGQGVSIDSVVRLAGRVWGRRVELTVASPGADGTQSTGDPAALRALGWRARRTLAESLAAVAAGRAQELAS
jgi:GDP-4-dehydro-6-deoxy-D-mannose reductase